MRQKRINNWIGLVIFSSAMSCNNSFDKIDISDRTIDKVKTSMNFITMQLEKSGFDTLLVEEYILEKEVNMFFLYPNGNNLDSVTAIVKNKLDIKKWMPFKKGIYLTNDSNIIFNNRLLGSNIEVAKKNILNSKELNSISIEEKAKFIDCFSFLLKNHIKGCFQDINNFYAFSYTKTGLHDNRRDLRYLYRDKDYNNNNALFTSYDLLDEKKGIILLKEKGGKIPE